MKTKITFIVIISCLALYSLWYCPNDLEITRYMRKYNKGNHTIKIAHITDLHTSGFGTIEKKLTEALKKEEPDLIVITGDIATPRGTFQGYKNVLSKIKAPLGVYFVMGNWEYWSPIENLEKLLAESNIQNLTNKKKLVKDNLWLIGFDDALEGIPDQSLLRDTDSNTFKVGLFHSPVFFNQTHRKINLSLSGHSHGGQVRFPFLGAFWTPHGTEEFVSGWYKKNESELYVSRGIGNSILPIRFNCRPELTIFEIQY